MVIPDYDRESTYKFINSFTYCHFDSSSAEPEDGAREIPLLLVIIRKGSLRFGRDDTYTSTYTHLSFSLFLATIVTAMSVRTVLFVTFST